MRAHSHSAVSNVFNTRTHRRERGGKLTVDPYVLEGALLAHVEARDADEGDGRRRRVELEGGWSRGMRPVPPPGAGFYAWEFPAKRPHGPCVIAGASGGDASCISMHSTGVPE